jgi:hypothetical protein
LFPSWVLAWLRSYIYQGKFIVPEFVLEVFQIILCPTGMGRQRFVGAVFASDNPTTDFTENGLPSVYCLYMEL